MNVVVWKSYGDISVYQAETADDIKAIVGLVMDCLDDWGIDDFLGAMRERVAATEITAVQLRRIFNELVMETRHTEHEAFESIYMTHVKSAADEAN